jgi:hypothetical protein
VQPQPVQPGPGGDIAPWPVVPEGSSYHLARIVGAMLNPKGADEGKELVTIFNCSPEALDLAGWTILDAQDKEEALSGRILPGYALTVTLSGKGAQLSNKGGTITLLNASGLKVDGVSYTKKDAERQGYPLAF